MPPIPPTLARTTLDLHRDAGAVWLRDLPRLLADCAARWSLTVESPFENLSYHYVAPATRADGARAVLKAGVPGPTLRHEAATLRHYDGQGAARLLEVDEDRGVLLLERLEPGTSLAAMSDDTAATRIAAGVMRHLWKPAPASGPWPTIAVWGQALARLRARFGGGTGPLPEALVATAERVLGELLGSSAAPVLLHGDLHHGNLLSAEREPWLAIDPQGVLGEPAFEVGQFLLNPAPQPPAVLARRLDVFVDELGLERSRLRRWGLVKAVLSACWSVEDHGQGWEGAMAVAEILAALPE